jgi:WD40 repeat protein
MWDPATLAPISDPVQAHPSRIWSLAVANTSRRLLTSGSDGSVKIWHLDHDTLQQVGVLSGHSGEVHPLAAFSLPDGRDAVLTGGHDGTIKGWGIDSEECLITMFLGMPVHALGAVRDAHDGSARRFVTVGTRRGIISLALFFGE